MTDAVQPGGITPEQEIQLLREQVKILRAQRSDADDRAADARVNHVLAVRQIERLRTAISDLQTASDAERDALREQVAELQARVDAHLPVKPSEPETPEIETVN